MTKYQEYALVQKQIDELEAKKELLRAEIELEVPDDGHKDEFIIVTWRTNRKWSYSDTVKILEMKLKDDKTKIEKQKELEENDGTATAEETKSLVIKVK